MVPWLDVILDVAGRSPPTRGSFPCGSRLHFTCVLSCFSRVDSVRPHRWRPTRLPRPWDSPGKNTGVGCHFLLQCMKGKSEREVAQSCPTLSWPQTSPLLKLICRSAVGCGTGSPSVGESSLRKRIQMAIFTKICDPGDTTPGSIAAWEGPVVNRGRC